MERCCHARCAVRRQQHERRRAADLGIRTLHGRQAPPPGRQPTTRRQSRSHSGPLRLPNPPVHHRVPPRDPKSARQRRFPAPLTPPGPPRRHPYLEHQSDTGAPSPSWHPQAYHGVAYTDRSNARMALMAPLHMRDLPTLSSAASSCWVPPAVFRSARRSSSRTRHGRQYRGRSAHQWPRHRRRPPARLITGRRLGLIHLSTGNHTPSPDTLTPFYRPLL